MAEMVICRCKQCRNIVGKFINRWYEIGMYAVPIIGSDDNVDVLPKEKHILRRAGYLDGKMMCCSRLQIIACVSCDAFLGLKCVETPGNQVLERNQILFYHGSIKPFNDAGKRSHFFLDRVFTNTEPSSRASPVSSAETPGESGTPRRVEVINNALSKNELPRQASNEMTKVGNQMQQELVGLRSQVSDLLVQVGIIASKANDSVSTTNDGNEVATLRAENADLRRLLSNMRSIESLQRDFDILKSRVERLQGDQQTAKNLTSPNCHKRTSSEAGLPETDIAGELPNTPAIYTSPCLARRSTKRRTAEMRPESSD